MSKLPLKDPAKNFKTKKEKDAAGTQNREVRKAEKALPKSKHAGADAKHGGHSHPRSGKSKGKMNKGVC